MHKLRTLHLFAGAGGGILADILLGHQCVCAVEIDPYCQQVLSARQKDGCIPWFPIFSDVTKFDGKLWRGIVDVVSGGFPCQDISAAGKGAGIDGERSGLWREMARVVREVEPRFVLVENSPMLTLRGLGTVLGDLASMGYNAEWGVLGADDAGAPHIRKRIWILAYANTKYVDNGRYEAGAVCGIGQTETVVSGCKVAHTPQRGRLARGQGNTAQEPERREFDRGGVDADVADAPRILEGRSEQRAERERVGQGGESIDVANPYSEQAGRIAKSRCQCGFWESEPYVGRVAHGVAARVDRLKAIGNGQVPAVAALAWRILRSRI